LTAPVLAGTTTVLAEFRDSLHASDAATGDRHWHVSSPHYVSPRPAVADDVVLVPCGDQELHAADASSTSTLTTPTDQQETGVGRSKLS